MEELNLAFLICFYLTRWGKVSLEEASKELKVKAYKLAPVFKALTEDKIVNKNKELYELFGNPKVLDLFKAFYPMKLLTDTAKENYSRGDVEYRELTHLVNNIDKALNPILEKTLRAIGNDLILAEIQKMNLDEQGASN